MERWTELRTAYLVAKLGTVTAAARALGLHRATVIRHVDALERELGGRLFLRHARGYEPTEAGRDLLRVADATEEQFSALEGRLRGASARLSGEVVVTSVEVIAPLVMAALDRFLVENPRIRVRYDSSDRALNLEYGEAHVAIRARVRPDQPDNVVLPFLTLRSGLYVHRSYVEAHGMPDLDGDLTGHRFVGDLRADSPFPFSRWIQERDEAQVAFASANPRVNMAAIRSGLGIGFFPEYVAADDPELIELRAPEPAWDVPFWLVTHVDQHRTPKVQALLAFLRETRS